ncbi:uncharacterized protein EDB91DRAFT_1342000 [Suillus paluster]|uniref:uncharacterized protein n=1 Tax=Suillus paluster TaxID=48578 RepID=UPI001B85BCD0|nr:uncharacterized protein EDB91DRAFT_1342000 [Suillus paluster]KAG1756230.1 hypothetical protein EDB91DRAFT_1342000 [Suillus paluster]
MSITFNLSTIVMIIFVFMVIITVLGILLLVTVRVRRRDERHARHSWFSRFPRSKESSGDDLTVFVSPSRPTIVGRTSTKGCPVIHMTVTPPTPAQIPSRSPKADPCETGEVHKLSRDSCSEGVVYGYAM